MPTCASMKITTVLVGLIDAGMTNKPNKLIPQIAAKMPTDHQGGVRRGAEVRALFVGAFALGQVRAGSAKAQARPAVIRRCKDGA